MKLIQSKYAGVATALALIATLLTGPPTVLAAPATPGGVAVTRLLEQKSEDARPDLTVTLRRLSTRSIEPGDVFSLEAIVENEARGPGKPVRVWITLPDSFAAVQVTDAPGFSCTVRSRSFECRGGQVPPDREVRIGVVARAPQREGDYDGFAVVDPQDAVDEVDEDNNRSDDVQLFVRHGDGP
jgi:hypothetical protein